MRHYNFQTEITLENLIWAARSQEFISYHRLNQSQGIADQDWSYASSLLMRHLDQLANKIYRESKPVFPFFGCRAQRTGNRQTHHTTPPPDYPGIWRRRTLGKRNCGLH
ncbi:MAG: hypothetical protein CBC43_004530 [Rhizobiales bacterium TMED83]|nr:MAG: hypothetical protein CBC43_004530 [Rhizobiales bacterium TMED83]